MTDRWLTLQAAADLCGVSRTEVVDLVEAHILPATKHVDGRWMCRVEDVEREVIAKQIAQQQARREASRALSIKLKRQAQKRAKSKRKPWTRRKTASDGVVRIDDATPEDWDNARKARQGPTQDRDGARETGDCGGAAQAGRESADAGARGGAAHGDGSAPADEAGDSELVAALRAIFGG